jgi:hypothetical protein
MDAIGLRFDYRLTPFQDLIKDLDGGKFQLYFGGYGGIPSGYAQLMQLYGKDLRRSTPAASSRPITIERWRSTCAAEATPSRSPPARRMSEIAKTFVPIIPAIFRLENDFVQPWIVGYRPQTFQTYWKYVDIDLAGSGGR